MQQKRCNYKTDLVLTETFYELSANNSLVVAMIPDDAIDFEIAYRAEDNRRFTVSRKAGVYKNCEKFDDNTLITYIQLSKQPLGEGTLSRELMMRVPSNNFESQIRNVCVPSDTRHFLWRGATDNDIIIKGDVVIATILKGNQGDAFQYKDFTSAQIEILQTPATQAATLATQATQATKQATLEAIDATDSLRRGIDGGEAHTRYGGCFLFDGGNASTI